MMYMRAIGQWRQGMRAVSATALVFALAGCGFGLRPAAHFPFKSLYSSTAPYSPIGVELQRQLPSSGALTYLTDPAKRAEAQVVLDVFGEQRTKSVIGVNATGQAREFQLRLSLKFRLHISQGNRDIIPETQLTQQRTLSYDETLALAKEAEEASLYRNMQAELVQQIVRRLAALDEKALNPPTLE